MAAAKLSQERRQDAATEPGCTYGVVGTYLVFVSATGLAADLEPRVKWRGLDYVLRSRAENSVVFAFEDEDKAAGALKLLEKMVERSKSEEAKRLARRPRSAP